MATDLTNTRISDGYGQLLHADGGLTATEDIIYDGDGTASVLKIGTASASINDGAYDFDIASHDGSNGLKLGGTLVTSSAAELNYVDITTLGTSQASKAVTVNSSGDLIVPDSDKFKFGAGSDMQLYHDGSNSYITNATGALKLATETSGIVVTIGHTTSETTVADNLTVTGNTSVGGNLTVTGTSTFNGGTITLGDAASDTIAFGGTITGNLVFEGSTSDAHELTLSAGDPAGDVTVTLPVSTDTLVGKATTDTLTNKTLTTPVIAEIDSGSTITLDATTDIVLDAGGADVFLKDDGTTYGSLTNSSGNLIIKSGTTTAATFSGANVTLAGTVGSGAITSTGAVQGTVVTATTGFAPDAQDGAYLGTSSLQFSDLFLADEAVVAFGDDGDVTLTHVHNTGLLLTDDSGVGTTQLQFGDSGTYIYQKADGHLGLVGDTEIDISATTIDINGAVAFDGALTGITNITLSGTLSDGNYTFDTSGNVSGLGTIGSGAITSSGVVTASGFTIGSAAILEAELEILDGAGVTTDELNILDGSAKSTSSITIADADAFIVIDGNTTKQIPASDLETYMESSLDTLSSVTTVGTLNSGAISSGFGAIDIGSSALSTTGSVTLGATSFGDNAITNVGDIALDSISADGTDINIAVDDNSATALTIKQGSDAYLIVDTANSSESVSIGTGISGTAITLGHGTSETTVADNLTVTGNLTVSGTTTTVSSSTLTIGDSLIKLAQGYTGSAYDQGIVFTRGDGSSSNTQNMAFIYDESADGFATIKAATEAGTTAGNITVTDYMPLRVGALTADDASTFTSTISAATGSTIGNLTLANGSITDSSGAIDFGNETLATSGVITGGGFTIGSAAILEAELEILDGAAVTTTELNIIDGDTSATGTTLVAADRVVVNDNGTMVQVAMSDFETFMESNLDTLGSVTSLGTLTALTVDDVAINGKVVTMTGSTSDTAVFTVGTNGTLSIVTTDAAAAAANIQITADGTVDIDSAGVLTLDSGAAINIEPASGSAILLDGTISVDAGVVTGATSITSTAFVGALSTAAQTNVTSLGTLTALQVDYINANASTLTITDSSDTGDLASIAVTTHGATTLTTTDDDATAAHLTFDADGNITLDSATGIVTMEDGGTEVLRLTEGNSGDVTVKLVTNAKDLIFTDNGDAEGFRISDAAAGVKVAGTIDLGHATDTTIARSGSGAITVEGNQVYLAGGTDVPVADGGTGASSLTANGVLIGNGTSAVAAVDLSTKGHILIGDGSGNPSALSVGSNDYVLTADSSEATGTKWAALSSAAITGTANGANNYVATYSASAALNGEANLQFDGTVLGLTGTIKIVEQADAESDTAGSGQIWVNTATPNELYFTTDAGNDIALTSGTAIAAPVTALNNATANELVTVGSTTTELDAESGLTFDGTTLDINHASAGVLRLTGAQSGSDGSIGVIEGYTTTGTDRVLAKIEFQRDDDDAAGSISFFVDDAGGTAVERVTLDNSGKLGIGTTSPDKLLHIASSAATGGTLRLESTDTSLAAGDSAGVIDFETQDSGSAGVGAYIDAEAQGSSGEISLVFGTGSGGSAAERMRINDVGDVSIGYGSPKSWLATSQAVQFGTQGAIEVLAAGTVYFGSNYYQNAAGSNKYIGTGSGATRFRQGGGYFYFDSTGASGDSDDALSLSTVLTISDNGTFTGSSSADISDVRLKENISDVENALDTINQIRGRTFTWKPEADMASGTKYGLIAQELEGVLPDLVYNDSGIRSFNKEDELLDIDVDESDIHEWSKSVHMSGLIPVLVEAVKELSAKVEALEAK